MNNIIFSFISLVSFYSLFSQDLSISQLENLVKQTNSKTIDTLVIDKGWLFHKTENKATSVLNNTTWYYPMENSFTPSINLFTYNNIPQKIEYITYNEDVYNTISKTLKNSNYTSIEDVKDGELVLSFFENKNYIVSIIPFKKNDDFTGHIDVILKNSLYDAFDEKLVVFSDDNKRLKHIIEKKNEEFHGKCISFNENGNLYLIGYYKNGLQHGGFSTYYDNGTLKSKWTMVNDKYHGEDVSYEENRHISQNYVNNVLSGDYNIYMFNSKKDTIEHLNANYTNNKFHGITKHYKIKNNKKTLINKRHYVDGLLDGTFARVKNDTIIFGEYKNDTVNGTIRFYKDYNKLNTEYTRGLDTTGVDVKLITKGNYKSGVKNGTWEYYSVDGEVIKKGEYINNKQVGTWQYTYKDKGIIKDIQYTDNKAGLETYKTINTEKLYSGKLNFKDKNGVIEQVRIKDGYRNGLTIHKDTSGKETKKIKYKNGVIKN